MHAEREAVIAHQVLPRGFVGTSIFLLAGELPVDRTKLEPLRHIHTVARVEVFAEVLPLVLTVDREPVIGLLPEQVHKFQQERVSSAVVQPRDGIHFVAGACLAPISQRTFRQFRQHESVVPGEKRHHPRVARGFRVVAQDEVHHHAWPPIIILSGAVETVFALMFEGPFYPFAGAGFQSFVIEDVGERDQPFEVIRSFFPVLSFTAEPATFRVQFRNGLFGMPSQTVALQFQLLQEPAAGAHRSQGQRGKRFFLQRRAVVRVMEITGGQSTGVREEQDTEDGHCEVANLTETVVHVVSMSRQRPVELKGAQEASGRLRFQNKG